MRYGTSSIGWFIIGGVLSFIFMLVITVYTVDQGERGVILRNGAVIGTADPGLHFKLPIFDSIRYISVQSRKVDYPSLSTYSRDQQPADIKMSINYHVNIGSVDKVYSEYGSEENMIARLVDPKANSELKNVFGQFNAATAIQERERLNREVKEAVVRAVNSPSPEGPLSGPITVEGVQIENIDFSDAYEKSVEERMLAEVEVQKVKQNWEREKVQADIVETKANAEATAIKVKGEAEAAVIYARGKALRDNPGLVSLVQAEKWNGVLPSTMVPNSSIPIIGSK